MALFPLYIPTQNLNRTPNDFLPQITFAIVINTDKEIVAEKESKIIECSSITRQ